MGEFHYCIECGEECDCDCDEWFGCESCSQCVNADPAVVAVIVDILRKETEKEPEA